MRAATPAARPRREPCAPAADEDEEGCPEERRQARQRSGPEEQPGDELPTQGACGTGDGTGATGGPRREAGGQGGPIGAHGHADGQEEERGGHHVGQEPGRAQHRRVPGHRPEAVEERAQQRPPIGAA